MEAERGLVYPRQTMLDNIQIDASSYDVVKVDIMHENSKDLKLEVPPYDTMLTLRDGITRRVLWRMTFIDVDPSTAASASATASQLNTSPASIFLETRPYPSPIQEQSCPSSIREQPRPSPPQTRSTPSLHLIRRGPLLLYQRR
jgi:hypothetical protein